MTVVRQPSDDCGIAGGKSRQWRQRAAILRHGMGGGHRPGRRLDLGQDGDRGAGRPLAGPGQARHLLEQVADARRAIFAHPAERLQYDPAGYRPMPGSGRAHDAITRPSNRPSSSIADTGTSFSAGQTLSTTDDKWLRKIGAEQKIVRRRQHLRLDRGDPARAPRTRAFPPDSSRAGSAAAVGHRESTGIAAYWPRCGQNRKP